MPELPEIHAMVADLAAHLDGRTVDRFQALSFAVMKTFDPPTSALAGEVVRDVSRHGTYLDLEVGELHLVVHLALLGWIRWRKDPPLPPSRLGKGPVAARLVLDDGSGLDIAEFGTKKGLAIWIVRRAEEAEEIRPTGTRTRRARLPGLRRHDTAGDLRGLDVPVLPELSDRR